MSTKENQEKLVEIMKRWQKVEDSAVATCANIAGKSDHPIIRLVMEIILRDSQTHYAVQQMIVDSLQREHITLAPDDLANVWSMIEAHIEVEKKTIALAQEALEAIKGTGHVVQQYLLEYLLEDERKHDTMLANLQSVQKGMYPCGG